MTTKRIEKQRTKRERRVRGKMHGTETAPRLSVFRSAKHIYVQAIDDDTGRTLAAASTVSPELRGLLGKAKKLEAAREVGKLVGVKLKEKGIGRIVFDRGRFLYHGRVKALADAARGAGVSF